MKQTILSLLVVLCISSLSAQKSFTLGPTAGFMLTNFGDSDYYTLQPNNSGDAAFGISARLFENKWRFRTDVVYHSIDVEVSEDRMINAVQRQVIEAKLSQPALFVYGGAEYHFKPEGIRPFIGAGLDFSFLLDYNYEVDICVTTTSGSKSLYTTLDDSTAGGEYGIYISGGIVIGKLNLEARYHTGARNRSDFSLPISRVGALTTYFF